MKIGIITFWETQDNYGQILQAYALQRLLEDAGHEPFLIRYSLFSDMKPRKERWKSLFSPVRLFNFIKRKTSRNIMNTTLVDRKFNDFKRHYIHSTSNVYRNLEELQANPPKADCYICGSDQIWYSINDYEVYQNITKAYFLDFGDLHIPRYAVAASFGRTDFPQGYIDYIRPLLSRFNGVTVREVGGINVCSRAGYTDTKQIFDPTCLCPIIHYTRISVKPKIDNKYIFVYIVGQLPFNYETLQHFAAEKGCKIVMCVSQNQSAMTDSIYPTVEEWLGWIEHADYVITNSFHGSVFAIIFQRQLAIYTRFGLTRQGGDDRFMSMLERIGMISSIVSTNVVDTLSKRINYSQIIPLFQKEQQYDWNLISKMIHL